MSTQATTSAKPDLSCSFCQKTNKEVEILIAGIDVYICNECVEVCNQIVREETARLTKEEFNALMDSANNDPKAG